MASFGYGYAPIEGLLSLAKELEKDSWASIDISKFLPGGVDPPKSLLEATPPQWIKYRIVTTAADLSALVSEEPDSLLTTVDDEWDDLERELDGETYVHTVRKDPLRKAASLRIRAATLKGDGTGQTQLPIAKEIDWGRMQIEVIKNPPLSDDVALLGFGPLFERIDQKTEEMAEAAKAGRRLHSERLRVAKQKCQNACNDGHSGLESLLEEKSLTDEQKTQLKGMLAPMVALLARYRAPARTQDKKEVKENVGKAEEKKEEEGK